MRNSEVLPQFSWVKGFECDVKTVAKIREQLATKSPTFLWGPSGSGKTAVAAHICIEEARRLAEQMQVEPSIIASGMWFTTIELVQLVRRARFEKGVVLPGASQEINEGHLWKRFARDKLMVLDDVGVGGFDEQGYEILWRLTDIRQRLPTIYTSNFSPEQIRDKYDPRVHSRLCCGLVLELLGKDRRLAKQKKAQRNQEKP